MFATFTTAVRRVAATTALAALLAGPPWVLLRYLDQPWPQHLPGRTELTSLLTSPLSDTTLGLLLTGLLWLAWASFAWSAIAELAAALLGLRIPQPRGLTPARGIAALLVALITSGTLLTAASAALPAQAAAHSSTQHAHPPRPPAAAAASTLSHAAQVGIGTPPQQPPSPPLARDAVQRPAASTTGEASIGRITLVAAGRAYTYTVHRGDTLSDIAKQYLGDAHRWPEIFALNRGSHFPHVGGTLTNPNVIYPGWTLHLPDDANPPQHPDRQPGGAPSTPTRPPHTGMGPAPTAPATALPSSPSSSTPHTAPPSKPAISPSDPSDGVVPAPPITGPTTTTPASPHPSSPHPSSPHPSSAHPSSAASPTGPQHSNPAGKPDSGRPPGISLLSGSWLDIGLAAAIAAAVALVWAHRRHRYTPRPLTADGHRDDPDLKPLPPPINQAIAALHRLRRSNQPSDDDRADSDHPDSEDPGRLDAIADSDGDGDADGDRDSDASFDTEDMTEPQIAMPVVPALAHPLAAVWPPAGVGLLGPGAAAAARGFLVAGLAAGGLTNPDDRAWVIMPSATAATLLGAAAVTLPATPRLTVTPGLDDALDLLEQQVMYRSRLVYQHETDTVAALRDGDPYEEPLPPILFLADATGLHERTRIVAVLTQGQRLDIHGVLLGAWPDGNTITVTADGTTRPADGDAGRHGAHPADIGRLSVIDLTEAANLITLLAESHTGHPQPPAPTEPTPTGPATPHHDTNHPDQSGEGGEVDEAAAETSTSDPATGPAEGPAAAVGTGNGPVAFTPVAGLSRGTASTAAAEPGVPGTADDAEALQPPPQRAEQQPERRPVAVTVLGPLQILGAPEDANLRPKGLELLVYLAARDGAAHVDQILEDLIPEAPHQRAPKWLHNYVSSLRGVLRQAGGAGTYVLRPRHKWYALDHATLDIDLWRMRTAIKTAAHTDDPDQHLAALREAVACYQGPLAKGLDYPWAESYREGARRQALDATAALLHALDGQPAEQLAIATAAIGLHPHAESLYQAAMRAHHQLGDLDAIRQLRRDVTAALAKHLDAEPAPDTLALADRLVTDLQTRPRRTPQPRAGRGHP